MRLHLMQDEKVINMTINNFERVFPDDNRFVVILPKGRAVPKFVKEQKNIFFVHYNTKAFWNAIQNVENYTHVLFHSVWPDADKFLATIKHNNISWFVWGADLYEILECKGYELYFDKKRIEKVRARGLPIWIFKGLIGYRDRRLKARVEGLEKIKCFVSEFPQEFQLLKLHYPSLKEIEWKPYFYYPIDIILNEELLKRESEGNNIYIGNSASIHSNHDLLFIKLSKLNLGKRRVYTPLSYGSDRYADYVTDLGKKLLPENFEAIRTFIPIHEYYSQFLSSNIFIYGNYRQSAFGNILVALYFGGKVFLDKKNPLYDFFKSINIVLFELEDLNQQNIDTPLPRLDKSNNRSVIADRYSSDKLYTLISRNFS